MTRPNNTIGMICGWLLGEIGGHANVYHEDSFTDQVTGQDVHVFQVSVRFDAIADLVMLGKVTGQRVAGGSITIARIRPLGTIEQRGSIARRDFAIHIGRGR